MRRLVPHSISQEPSTTTRVGPRWFGKGGPLRVSHHPAASSSFHSSEFPPCDEWWLGCPRIAAIRRHDIGKVQSARLNPDQHLPRLRDRLRDVTNLQYF